MALQALSPEGHKQDRITIQPPMSELFQTVASQFQSNNQYQKFIRECEKEYDIKVYRLASFTVAYARKIHAELNEKYQGKTLEPNPSGWYENERRLFVWFVLCFMHYKVLDPSKFIDSGEKYWRQLSEVFWGKEVYFLKYQLLNLFKAKGRIVWRAQEDQLLRKVFRNFKFGEWNEVAKEFYRESNEEFFKTPKQCRERWQNHLNEGIRKGEWTPEEDLVIFEFIAKNQRKNWAQIVKNMNQTRTEHMIKNRYKSLTNKVMAEKKVGEDEAAKIILTGLQGQPQIIPKDEQEDIVILEVESQMIYEEEGQKVERAKSPKREIEPQGSNKMMSFNDSNCMRVDGRDSQVNPFWDNLVRYDSINPFNRSVSNYGASLMLYDSGKFFKAFPLLEMPKQQERKNTIFDPSESYKSTNSVKNVDSIIVKIISNDN